MCKFFSAVSDGKGNVKFFDHKLSGKTQAANGTERTTFVGGTEASPTIELGETVFASAIQDDICIFWMEETRSPGSGWTEITAVDGKFLYIDIDETNGQYGHDNFLKCVV